MNQPIGSTCDDTPVNSYKQKKWESEFDEIIESAKWAFMVYGNQDGFKSSAVYSGKEIRLIKEFISSLKDKPEKQAQSEPMGVSSWKAHGVKYGYDKYFKEQFQSEMREGIKDRIEVLLQEDRLTKEQSLNYLNNYLKIK